MNSNKYAEKLLKWWRKNNHILIEMGTALNEIGNDQNWKLSTNKVSIALTGSKYWILINKLEGGVHFEKAASEYFIMLFDSSSSVYMHLIHISRNEFHQKTWRWMCPEDLYYACFSRLVGAYDEFWPVHIQKKDVVCTL